MIESHERDPFPQSFAQIQAAGKLNCIGRAKHMPSQKRSRQRGHLGNELDDVKSGEIIGQDRNRAITLFVVRFRKRKVSPYSLFSFDGRLWTVGVGGGAVTEIRTGLAGVRANFLDWSPDGRTIAFTGSEGGDEELWLMEDFIHLVKGVR